MGISLPPGAAAATPLGPTNTPGVIGQSPIGGVVTANVLTGATPAAGITTTTATTTLITVPVGRIWVGTLSIIASALVPAASTTASSALAQISLSGAGSTPAPGTYVTDFVSVGAQVAGSLAPSQLINPVSTPFVIVAGANPVLVNLGVTIAGTARVDALAVGMLQ